MFWWAQHPPTTYRTDVGCHDGALVWVLCHLSMSPFRLCRLLCSNQAVGSRSSGFQRGNMPRPPWTGHGRSHVPPSRDPPRCVLLKHASNKLSIQTNDHAQSWPLPEPVGTNSASGLAWGLSRDGAGGIFGTRPRLRAQIPAPGSAPLPVTGSFSPTGPRPRPHCPGMWGRHPATAHTTAPRSPLGGSSIL
jgi:hypothetical protein